MRKTAVFCLVGVVLLAGMTFPGVALQGGPPDHAEGEGDGPPDHANAGGDDGGSDGGDADGEDGDGDDDSDDSEDDSDDADGEDAGDDGGATETSDASDATDTVDTTDTVDAVDTDDSTTTATDADEADDGPTVTETQESEGTGESPTDTVAELLPIDDEDDPIGDEDDSQGETPEETQTSHDSDDPLPLPDDEETETPESEPTPAGDGGDDGAEESADSSDGDGDAEPTVEISTNDSATVADVSDVEAGDAVEADLRGPATDGEHVALESVDVRVDEAGPFTLTVTRPTGGAGEAGGAAPGVPVSYVDVGTDAGVEGATLTLSVEESALPEGVQPADVEVLRQTDEGWEPTETTYHEDEGVYTAETSGLSTFAVVAPSEGPLEVTDAEMSGNGASGGNATAVATVENTGDRRATETFAATVDGETVATRELTLGGGESATVTFDVPADRAREGTVAVDGVEAGQLQVEETGDDSSPVASSSRDVVFGVGAAVFVVLSAVGTGLLAARREDWDWEL